MVNEVQVWTVRLNVSDAVRSHVADLVSGHVALSSVCMLLWQFVENL